MRPNEEKNSIIFSSVHVFTQPRPIPAVQDFRTKFRRSQTYPLRSCGNFFGCRELSGIIEIAGKIDTPDPIRLYLTLGLISLVLPDGSGSKLSCGAAFADEAEGGPD